jgi:hypothetical protein
LPAAVVLAAFLHVTPVDAEDILCVLGSSAITDPYRQAVYDVISGMVRDGRPIDELTLDWAIAERGVTLHPEGGEATYGERLARVHVTLHEALTAARVLQGQRDRAQTPAGSPQQQTSASRRVTGTRSQGHPAGSQLAPVVRLHKSRSPLDGPDPGPRPR